MNVALYVHKRAVSHIWYRYNQHKLFRHHGVGARKPRHTKYSIPPNTCAFSNILNPEKVSERGVIFKGWRKLQFSPWLMFSKLYVISSWYSKRQWIGDFLHHFIPWWPCSKHMRVYSVTNTYKPTFVQLHMCRYSFRSLSYARCNRCNF